MLGRMACLTPIASESTHLFETRAQSLRVYKRARCTMSMPGLRHFGDFVTARYGQGNARAASGEASFKDKVTV